MRLHIGATRHQLETAQGTMLDTDDWVHLAPPETLEQQDVPPQPLSRGAKWMSFFYSEGDRLPFSDQTASFVFSEQFFEHLFCCEAVSLFKECYRMMQSGACIRTVVPDADLRTYLEPEPIGFTTGDNRWCHPDKHKSRWSIYSLPCLLELIGFETRGVVYCDKHGRHIVQPPAPNDPFYQRCLDLEVVCSTDYICRFEDSLIVDAIKR